MSKPNIFVRRTVRTVVVTVDVNKTTTVETTTVEENPDISDDEKKAMADLKEMFRHPPWWPL